MSRQRDRFIGYGQEIETSFGVSALISDFSLIQQDHRSLALALNKIFGFFYIF